MDWARGAHRLVGVALIVATLTSAVCALFAHVLEYIMRLQMQNPQLLLLLPLVLWMSLKADKIALDGSFFNGISLWLKSPVRGETLSELLLIPFCWLSHLAGASVGRESVAVHAGQAVSRLCYDFFAPAEAVRAHYFILRVGIVSGFAALFGAPFSALIFAYEWKAPPSRQWLSLPRKAACLVVFEFFVLLLSGYWADFLSRSFFVINYFRHK